MPMGEGCAYFPVHTIRFGPDSHSYCFPMGKETNNANIVSILQKAMELTTHLH